MSKSNCIHVTLTKLVMRAKSNQNGNEKHMAKMGTTCPLKYLCSLLSQDTLPRAGEAVPHEGVWGVGSGAPVSLPDQQERGL